MMKFPLRTARILPLLTKANFPLMRRKAPAFPSRTKKSLLSALRKMIRRMTNPKMWTKMRTRITRNIWEV